jgi:hypothetical protein
MSKTTTAMFVVVAVACATPALAAVSGYGFGSPGPGPGDGLRVRVDQMLNCAAFQPGDVSQAEWDQCLGTPLHVRGRACSWVFTARDQLRHRALRRFPEPQWAGLRRRGRCRPGAGAAVGQRLCGSGCAVAGGAAGAYLHGKMKGDPYRQSDQHHEGGGRDGAYSDDMNGGEAPGDGVTGGDQGF